MNLLKVLKPPCYIYDIAQLEQQIKLIRSNLEDKVGLCYALKANAFIIEEIDSDPNIDRLEVCSPGEYIICKKYKIAPEKIIVSGVNKTYESIKSIFEYSEGKGIYTIESYNHYEILDRCAKENGYNIKVLVRLSSGNQFGVCKDEFDSILSKIINNKNMTFIGLHYYSGTQKKMVKIQKELKQLDDYVASLRKKYNIEYFELEYGPGMFVSYFEGTEVDSDEIQLKQLNSIIKELKSFNKITLEFGRFIAANCGYYLARINDIKRSEKVNYIIIEGGIHHMNYYGQLMGMKKPYMKHIGCDNIIRSLDDSCGEKWTICGSLCTTNDVLVREKNVDNPSIDDIIIFEKVGAYSANESMALFLSRDLPLVFLLTKNNQLRYVRGSVDTFSLNN